MKKNKNVLHFAFRAMSALALASAGDAFGSSVVTVSGYGGNLTQPYGYQVVAGSELGNPVAQVDSGWFYVPYGFPNDFGDNWPTRYAGYGFANDSTGVLRARAVAEGIPPLARWIDTQADLRGFFALGQDAVPEGDPKDTFPFTLSMTVDGTVSDEAFGGPMFLGTVLRACRVGGGPEACRETELYLNGAYGNHAINEILALNLEGAVGDLFDVTASLIAEAWIGWGGNNYSVSDFSNTARLSFALPPGLTIVGQNGFLSAAPVITANPVPEPGTLGLLCLAVLGLASRCKPKNAKQGTVPR